MSIVYLSDISFSGAAQPRITVRAMNKAEKGLGLPLPAGPVALFERQGGRELLIGESSTADKAVGEEVEIKFGGASNVTLEHRALPPDDRKRPFEVTVRNANPFPIRFEGDFDIDPSLMGKMSQRLARKNGRNLWAVTVPANGSSVLRYRVTVPE